jgi:hypothetical protein
MGDSQPLGAGRNLRLNKMKRLKRESGIGNGEIKGEHWEKAGRRGAEEDHP